MYRLIFTTLAILALASSARAQTVQVPVTPRQMEYSNFTFSVNTVLTNGGTAFHVTITTKTEPIQSDCVASLALVTGTAAAPAVAGITPPVPFRLTKNNLTWTADFVAPAGLLTDPTADLIFVVPDYKTEPNGSHLYLPTDRMYEMRLQDFLPQ